MAQAQIHVGIIQFPGTNCEYDTQHVLSHLYQVKATILWHEQRLGANHDYDCLILPGGFSYGDYLRAGAMSILSPIIADVVAFANAGGLVLGICNGFQALTELKLLPGALLRNKSLNFVSKVVSLRVESNQSPFLCLATVGATLRMPIAHGEGCYYVDETTLKAMQKNNQILLRYVGENPNGSVDHIAAVSNERGNVMGLMPHPERCCEAILNMGRGPTHGGEEGKILFDSLLSWLHKRSEPRSHSL